MVRLLLATSLLAGLTSAQERPGALGPRTLEISLTDKQGAPVEGLTPQDLVVLEDGVARRVLEIKRDERPLSVLVLVDNSLDLGSSLRLSVVGPVLELIRGLPEGARYSLWTTGDRPEKRVDFTDDRGRAVRALRRAFPRGGNTMFDAVVEASRELELERDEAGRSAVIVVTGLTTEFSSRSRYDVVEQARDNADLFSAVVINEGSASQGKRVDYEYVLRKLSEDSGGVYEFTLSAMGVASRLRKVEQDLRARYLLTYEAPAEHEADKIVVEVARPGTRVRLARRPD